MFFSQQETHEKELAVLLNPRPHRSPCPGSPPLSFPLVLTAPFQNVPAPFSGGVSDLRASFFSCSLRARLPSVSYSLRTTLVSPAILFSIIQKRTKNAHPLFRDYQASHAKTPCFLHESFLKIEVPPYLAHKKRGFGKRSVAYFQTQKQNDAKRSGAHFKFRGNFKETD